MIHLKPLLIIWTGTLSEFNMVRRSVRQDVKKVKCFTTLALTTYRNQGDKSKRYDISHGCLNETGFR